MRNVLSLGAILNAPNGVNVRFYARFLTAGGANVGDQHESPNYVSDGTPATVTIDGLVVPATAAQVLIYLDGAGGDKYMQALWGVLADEAGPYPIDRTIVDADTGLSSAVTAAAISASGASALALGSPRGQSATTGPAGASASAGTRSSAARSHASSVAGSGRLSTAAAATSPWPWPAAACRPSSSGW